MISFPIFGKIQSAASRYPNHVALIESDGTAITYSNMMVSIKAVEERLHALGITEGQRVATLQNKSIEHVTCLLAIAQCGGIAVPIDPNAPIDRINFVLNDLQPHILIVESQFAGKVFGVEVKNTLPLSSTSSHRILKLKSDANINPELAYILYTSGSTGTPKGVCISHESLAAFVKWSTDTLPLSSSDRVASIAPTHFDLSIYDIYTTLNSGAALHVYNSEEVKNARMMTKMLSENNITSIYATPSFLSSLLQYGKPEKYTWNSMRQVMFAGEVFPVKHLHALMDIWQGARYFNLYGPTETNVCTWHEISTREKDRQHPYPIGHICEGLELEISEEGELFIGGQTVAHGYLNSEESSHSKFFMRNGKRWYKTGDKVARDTHGELVYAGRIDRMIKRRGYRIEPAEIEQALLRSSIVLEAAIVPFINSEGELQIAAFTVCAGSAGDEKNGIRTFLSTQLPDYMLPDQIIVLREFPKTSSGKIDYAALGRNISSNSQ